MKLKTLFQCLLAFTLLIACAAKKSSNAPIQSLQAQFPHPLNPLAPEEISLVRKILIAEKKIDTVAFRFYVINLQEPPKTEMLRYKPGDPFRREAFAIVFDRPANKTFEAVVDLIAQKVISFTHIPLVTAGSFAADSVADELLKKNPLWLAGLQKRGISPDSIKTSIVFAGEMGMAPPDHRELICTPQYINKKYHELLIDGLVAHVDVTTLKVLTVLDDGAKGFYKPQDIGYFDAQVAKVNVPETKPLKITQPEGNSFTIEGFKINGKSWTFRVGIDNREGLIIHDARFNDNGILRPVLYRASIAEMYVPYGSTDLTHASWNYFDVGAYRMGQSMPDIIHGMKLGSDVPENAVFLPGFFHDENGKPTQIDSVIAIYEEFGGPLTRHGQFSHPARNIVVKYFTKIWNYDYGFKWIFHENGTIDLAAELTGIVGIKGVQRTTDAPGSNDDSFNGTYYGTLVAPHVEAGNHQHFFSFRLDLDVDGPENIAEEMNTVPVDAGKTNPWNNGYVKQMSLIRNESDGQRNLNAGSNRHWMIADSKSVNSLGQQKSYVLMPGHNSSPYAASGSGPRKMADFLESQVWMTAFKDNESYPAGDYPNTRGIKDGLPAMASDNENLQGKDIVLWYNLGITHIVRPEDWPIMNVHTIGFTLMPFGFFDQNPVIKDGRKISVPKPAGQVTLPDVTLCVPLPKDRNAPLMAGKK
jgi:primary-amine oxidase